MNFEEFFSIRFMAVFLSGICLFVFLGGVSLSKNIEVRVNRCKDLIEEIQNSEYPKPEKMEELLKVVSIAGVRG